MLPRNLLLLAGILTLMSCQPNADLVVHNALVYTVNKDLDKVQAFAVKDGKFIDVGNNDILDKYKAKNVVDAQGLPIFPGLIDAHSHFLQLGLSLQQAQLEGTESFEAVLERVKDYATGKDLAVIYGRGWDQNDWKVKEFPTKEELDALFPETPVVLERIDGHAMLVNQKALDLAGIDGSTAVEGGTVVLKKGKPTGVLIDRPMDLVTQALPPFTKQQKAEALIAAQELCFKHGLTTVTDAGIDRSDIELIDSLQKTNALQMRVYAMIKNTKENLEYYLSNGIYTNDFLNVRSVKVYADGALGSRGAALLKPYADAPRHRGKMITDLDSLKRLAARIAKTKFQMNTHAIGDAANEAVLNAYTNEVRFLRDPRWRIEHAQVVAPKDFENFSKKIIPSVQPLHATSDMYWAKDRLGSKRESSAYAFAELLDNAGILTLGTDFPVEAVNPFHTFYAAVARKDLEGSPEDGYQAENKISRYNTLMGMTRWAAFANFEEDIKGTIEVGKFADFVILDRDIMEVAERRIPKTRVIATLINGKIVYSNRF
ncbi:MAG: amidohydrolase family protein [Flavobacteriaceae bacterium]|jgi:predicted amidohydrolase YtcJ|nr:amidohydrolase [Flavobacteriales bacterium]MDG1272613.1 amidohydrolase family protein [Flavobacteriaceae bacterium]